MNIAGETSACFPVRPCACAILAHLRGIIFNSAGSGNRLISCLFLNYFILGLSGGISNNPFAAFSGVSGIDSTICLAGRPTFFLLSCFFLRVYSLF